MSLLCRWSNALAQFRAQDRYRSLEVSAGIDFTSNDYLGYGCRDLLHSSRLPTERCPGELETGATSGTASRLLRGNHPVWDEVETLLASWHGTEAVLMMTSGYIANEGLLSTIIEPGDWVASDESNHASIIDGLRLNRPERFIWRHNDLNHLEEGLRAAAARRPAGQQFIVTESIFSMEGDRAPLSTVVALAERHGAHVIVDEAHATGCSGPRGSGLVDEAGLRSQVLATIHTGGKALGVAGAYICGSKLLKDYLVNRCRHLIYSTALPPALGGWWRAMIPRVQEDEASRQALHRNVELFRNELARLGITAAGVDQIVPVIFGANDRASEAALQLQKKGYDIRPIRPPSVPVNTARLRISIHADHDPVLLVRLAADLREALDA
jgi:8-amino-7-oxononanoate synthase